MLYTNNDNINEELISLLSKYIYDSYYVIENEKQNIKNCYPETDKNNVRKSIYYSYC